MIPSVDPYKGRNVLRDIRQANSNFLEDNKDWHKWVMNVSKDTGGRLAKKWIKTARINKNRFKFEWADVLVDCCLNKVGIMVGASPALERNYQSLLDIQNDERYVIVVVSSGLRFLLDKGIKPRYVVHADTNDLTTQYFKGLDTTNLTLIANCFSSTKALDKWKGNLYFLPIATGSNSRKLKREYQRIHGKPMVFPAAGNQYNFGVMVMPLVLGIRTIIFCGCEYSYSDKYYAGKSERMKDEWKKIGPIPDINGNEVETVVPLYQAKLALESITAKMDGVFINATEAGILGVNARYGYLPWIIQMKLDRALPLCGAAVDRARGHNSIFKGGFGNE